MTNLKFTGVPWRQLVYKINVTLAIIAALGILTLAVLTNVEVVSRYFLNSPISWTLEIGEILLILGAFLGMAFALQVGAHVSVDIVYLRYSQRRKRIADLIAAVLTLLFWTILTWKSVQQSVFYLERNISSETLLRVPRWFPMTLVVVGALFCCLQSIVLAYDAISALTGKKPRLDEK